MAMNKALLMMGLILLSLNVLLAEIVYESSNNLGGYFILGFLIAETTMMSFSLIHKGMNDFWI